VHNSVKHWLTRAVFYSAIHILESRLPAPKIWQILQYFGFMLAFLIPKCAKLPDICQKFCGDGCGYGSCPF